MENYKVQLEADKVDETVNYKGGFNYNFEDEGHLINVRCSSLSGKESIYVDNKLVAEKRSFRRKSSMEFMLSGDRYEVEFNVVNMLKGETHCTLIKNDVHIRTIKQALMKKYQLAERSLWFRLPIHFAFGATCGYLAVKYLPSMFGG